MLLSCHRHKTLVLRAIFASIALLAFGVAAAGSSAAGGKHYKYFLLPKFIGIPYYDQAHLHANTAAKELGDSVLYNGPTTPSAQAQVTFINNAAQQGVNAIIVAGNDPNSVAPALKQARSKGIKTLSFDGDVAKDARSLFVSGPKPSIIASTVVEGIAKQMGYKGDLAILSTTPDSPNQNSWIAATKRVLKNPKYSKLKIVTTIYGKEDDAVATTEIRGMLQTHPKVTGIIAYAIQGAAAARVLEAENKCKQIALYVTTVPSVMLPALKSGCVKESAIWSGGDLGYIGVYAARALLDGKITGKVGETFKAGTLGTMKIEAGGVVYEQQLIRYTKANAAKIGY